MISMHKNKIESENFTVGRVDVIDLGFFLESKCYYLVLPM